MYRQKPEKTDLELLQGTWVTTSQPLSGVKQEPKTVTFTFAGRNLALTTDQQTNPWEVTLDSKTAPKSWDMKHRTDPDVMKAVYSLEGDTLTVCHNYDLGGWSRRPKDLSDVSYRSKWVLKRQKP